MLFTLFTTGIKAIDVVVIVLGSLVAILGGTFAFTTCRFWLQSRGSANRFQGRPPLTLPYSIPWLGGFTRMLDPHGMYEYALSKSPNRRPVRLRVGPIGIYLVFGEKNVKTIFKSSKAFGKENSTILIFRSSGMGEADVDIVAQDKSGSGTIPRHDIPDENRIFKNSHAVGATILASGHAVNILTTKFIDQFIDELDKQPKGQSATVQFYDFFKMVMVVGSTTAVMGPEIVNLNPDYIKTYWDFDEAFLLLAIGLPKILYWKGYVARDRMLEATKRWINSAYKNFDERDADSDWEKQFGSRFFRDLVKSVKQAGISQDGQAASMLSMIWAINSNAIPCAGWILLESIQRPGVYERVRTEISAITSTNSEGKLTIDVPKLISQCPLLTSIYQECLRTRLSATVTRILQEDLECDGYILKKGNWIMSPSWLPSHDSLWDVPGHPANEFWPERFIEMPKMKPADPIEKSQFEQAMKQNHFFPYGGGSMVCTGRFFAKQEIMAAAAIMILKFDIEPQGWVTLGGKTSERAARPDENFAGAGVLPPDRDMMVKITRVR